MRGKYNYQSFIKEEFVRRFEDVIKQEILSHNEKVRQTDEKLDDISKQMTQFNADVHQEKKDRQRSIDSFRDELNASMNSLRQELNDQKRDILDALSCLEKDRRAFEEKTECYVSVKDLERLQKELERDICHIALAHDDTKNTLLKNIYSVEKKHLEHAAKLEKSFEEHRADLTKNYDKHYQKLSEHIKDLECASRDHMVTKRAVFIAEKKIEHIYTILDRSKEGGKSCHKPA